jgi:hypothetical protein
MTQVIRTNGDYKVQATNSGTITLDTSLVVITGNLTVQGTRTDVNVNNLYIEDNIINVNTGESSSHSGITLTYAGIEVNRGSANNVAVLYNENSSAWEFVETTQSGYTTTNSKIKVRTIITDASISSGDLALIGDHIGVVTVPTIMAPNDYTTQIRNRGRADDIPNKGYVDYAIANRTPQPSLGSDDTTVFARDKDVLNDGVSVSSIRLTVDGYNNVTAFSDKTFIHDLEYRQNIIENTNSANNLLLLTNGTGKVETNYAIQLDQITVDPTSVSGASVVYGKTPGAADSGIYFVNSSKSDELISKNKALVFSMLF